MLKGGWCSLMVLYMLTKISLQTSYWTWRRWPVLRCVCVVTLVWGSSECTCLLLLLANRWSCYIQFQCSHSILYVYKSLQVLTENKILYIDMLEAGFLGQISFQAKCKKIKRCHMISGGIGGFPEAKPVPCLSASTYCCFKPLYGCCTLDFGKTQL